MEAARVCIIAFFYLALAIFSYLMSVLYESVSLGLELFFFIGGAYAVFTVGISAICKR